MDDITSQMLDEAARYLHAKNLPEDRWLFETGVQWFKVKDIEGKIFGLSADALGKAAARGEFPGAGLPSKQAGWRIPWSGIAYYIAQERRAREKAAG